MHVSQSLIVISLSFLFSGCLSDESKGGGASTKVETVSVLQSYQASLLTVDADYSGSAIHLVNVDHEQGSIELGKEILADDRSDYTVSAYGDYFYLLGRYLIDLVYKFGFTNTETQLYSGVAGEGYELLEGESSLNTQEMVFVNENKAYLMNYGSDSVWIVNPSAKSENDFKLGELDLSAYSEGDVYGPNLPEVTAGMLVGERLFVMLGRLTDWCIGDAKPYIAVFDINTDTEIDIDSDNDPEGLKGIRLQIDNPGRMDYLEGYGLAVSGAAGGTLFCELEDPYTGGIEHIDIDGFELSSQLLIDDSADTGFITSLALLDGSTGLFVGYRAWADTALYRFNPENGDIQGVVSEFSEVDIRFLEQGPDGTIWLGIAQNPEDPASTPQLHILDSNLDVLTHFDLNRNPEAITFGNMDSTEEPSN